MTSARLPSRPLIAANRNDPETAAGIRGSARRVESRISAIAPPEAASRSASRLGSSAASSARSPTLSVSIGVMAPTLAMSITGVAGRALLGRAASLAYVVAAIGVGLVAYGFTRLSAEFSSAGSVYAFVGGALGPRAGFVAGWALLGTYLIFPVVSISADRHLRAGVPAQHRDRRATRRGCRSRWSAGRWCG